jgi:DNA-binding NtrC family response regulator
VDVRLVCATNRDLPRMVKEGRYREDLYYRISLVTLSLPPLRTYKDNLPLLGQILTKQAARKYDKDISRLTAPAVSLLLAHDFPGNMRELKNLIEHAVIMCPGPEIQPADLPLPVGPSPEEPTTTPAGRGATLRELREQWLAPLERRYLTELLGECDGNVRLAAERAGVNTVTLYRLLKKRGLRLTRRVRRSD